MRVYKHRLLHTDQRRCINGSLVLHWRCLHAIDALVCGVCMDFGERMSFLVGRLAADPICGESRAS